MPKDHRDKYLSERERKREVILNDLFFEAMEKSEDMVFPVKRENVVSLGQIFIRILSEKLSIWGDKQFLWTFRHQLKHGENSSKNDLRLSPDDFII